ncbi:aldo/keto reductase [Stutzerimonas zhaodongensis]|uniref:Aldo/keto reductase n=1 Tax=Stutzerimonas zhaodongensis TaxID=1176257 RepID=A0A3M2HP65_9GAMM|nr:aldo/keto reductase [Stutzerimonas zhaodongensis]MCQ4315300.1 aldo/keto reductase [Stutzerimonas zhaodongensis]RMH90135.1 aldo/keto reductase [Stutzerimonas zhaodongensis]
MRTLQLPDGAAVPVIGQGTWHMGENPAERQNEVAALRVGIELGMSLVDTAEMYAEGGAEVVVGEAIRNCRERVFLVSKVYPHNASRTGVPKACERSLRRLGTDCIDLYLLHWRGQHPLGETVEAFERLKEQGKIRRWGVSNLDLDDMHELDSSACATNQVLYNPAERGIEYDLLPWCQAQGMPVMAYCPLGQGGDLLRHAAVRKVALHHAVQPAQVALAWALRQPGVLVIPKSSSPEHLRANASAAELKLTADDLQLLDEAFPPPNRPQALQMV